MSLTKIFSVAALLALSGLNLFAQKIWKVADSVVDGQALCFTRGTWGIAINGQSFQQDALTSFNGFQYATYYDWGRRLCVARKNEKAGDWEVIHFADYQFKGNDSHNVAVLGLCARDGTIHLAFDHHGSPLHYRVSKPGVALKPEKYSWEAGLFERTTNTLEPGKPLARVTYPRFLRTPAGGLQFGCRIGSSGDGDKCLADYDAKTGIWKNFGGFAGSQGNYQGSSSRNAYLNGLTYDRRGRLHVTWCWRETGSPMTNHDLNYAYSDDEGVTWSNDRGQRVGKRGWQLLTIGSPGIRVVEFPMNRGLVNATTQAVDSRNRIHFVTLHLPDDVPQQANWDETRTKARFFHYWRDAKGKWLRNEMNFIGSRPQLWFDSADNAYAIAVGDRFNESEYLSVLAASAKSKWTDWKEIHREKGPFTGQPQVDRYAKANVLSVYVQEAPKAAGVTESPLRVMTFRAGN